MKCFFCNSEIPNESLFCPYCGHEVVEYKQCNVCGYKTEEKYEFCPMCGNRFGDKQECSYCGTETTNTSTTCDKSGRVFQLNTPIKSRVKVAKVKKQKQNRNAITATQNIKIKRIESIILAVVSLLVLICSFFGVMSIDMTEGIENTEGTNLDKKIAYHVTSIELIDFTFYSIGMENKDLKVLEYALNSKFDLLLNNLEDVFIAGEYHSLGQFHISKDACKKAEDIINELPYLKQTALLNAEYSSQSSTTRLQIGGVFCLIFIILSAAMLVLSIINIFYNIDKVIKIMLVISFGMLVFIMVILSGNVWIAAPFDSEVSSANSTIGLPFIFITFLLSAALIYFSVMSILTRYKTELTKLIFNSIGVVGAMVILSLFAAPALKLTLIYENRGTEFEYNYTNNEMFDAYTDNASPRLYPIQSRFEELAELYEDNTQYREIIYWFIGNDIGLHGVINNHAARRDYQWMHILLLVQAAIMILEIGLIIALLCINLLDLCGVKTKKLFNYIAFAIIVIASIFSLVTVPLIQICSKTIYFATNNSGANVTILFFAVLCIVGSVLTDKLLKKRLDNFLKIPKANA